MMLVPPTFPQVYKNVTDFTARELANLMWALAILDHRPAWILDCVLGHALDNLSSYSPNSLHLLVWSLAKLGHQPSEVSGRRQAWGAGGCRPTGGKGLVDAPSGPSIPIE